MAKKHMPKSQVYVHAGLPYDGFGAIKIRLSNGEVFDWRNPEWYFSDGTYYEVPGSEYHLSFPDGNQDYKKLPWSEAPHFVVSDYERTWVKRYEALEMATAHKPDHRFVWLRRTSDEYFSDD